MSALPRDEQQDIDCRSARTWVEGVNFRKVDARVRKQKNRRTPIGDYPSRRYKREHPEYWIKRSVGKRQMRTTPRLVKKG